ncbi:hypothetical protein PInf_000596 [Phytophthora infestans]|nr:hypothetical protein PInf_000596 [Phytophthora infestans]
MSRGSRRSGLVLCFLAFFVLGVATVHAAGNAGTFDFDAPSYTFQEDAGSVKVKIARTGDARGSVNVEYGLARPMDATATANKNFKFADPIYAVNFEENQLEGFINIELINDVEYEANEYFYIEIKSVDSSASIGTTNPIATVFISDDGDAGTFDFAAPYIFCREDSGNAVVTIERSIGFSSASYVPVALKVATAGADSNATDGGSKAFDYLGISQELTWATDEVTKTFAVKVFNNDKYQPNSRAIKARLLSVTGGATIGTKSEMWIYIVDDRDAGTISFALPHYEVLENAGKVTVKVIRSGIPDATNVNKYTDGEPAGTLFVQRFPAATVLLDSSRVTARENGGNDVTYKLQLGSEPMHWEPAEGNYEPFYIDLNQIRRIEDIVITIKKKVPEVIEGSHAHESVLNFTFAVDFHTLKLLVPKSKQPILLHKVTSMDTVYDGLQVGTNENNPSTGVFEDIAHAHRIDDIGSPQVLALCSLLEQFTPKQVM